MYFCKSCESTLEDRNDQCICGKTTSNHKGKVMGENFSKMQPQAFPKRKPLEEKNGQKVIERTKIRECPHCRWKGLVIPRLEIGCPSHGVWWHNSGIRTVEEDVPPKENTDDNIIDTFCWDDSGGDSRTNNRKERRDYKERGSLRRSQRKRQNRIA